MKRLSFAALALSTTTALLAATAGAYAQNSEPAGTPRLHGPDEAFVADAPRAVSTQREAARIADSRSADREVKAFAEHVADDDGKIADALHAASPRGIDIPRDEPDAAVLGSIRDLRGGDFDKAYIEQVALVDERRTLSIFQAEIASGRDGQLKDVASKALPTLQAHYAQAAELARRKHYERAEAK
jgi:putative membrane protein